MNKKEKEREGEKEKGERRRRREKQKNRKIEKGISKYHRTLNRVIRLIFENYWNGLSSIFNGINMVGQY